MQETGVPSLDWEDPLEKGMSTHSSILAWKIPWTEKPGGLGASLLAQLVKNLPAIQETRVQSLGQKDPLERGTATHSSILAWRIPWTEEPDGLHKVHGVTKSRTGPINFLFS